MQLKTRDDEPMFFSMTGEPLPENFDFMYDAIERTRDATEKHRRVLVLLGRANRDGVVTHQASAEFLARLVERFPAMKPWLEHTKEQER